MYEFQPQHYLDLHIPPGLALHCPTNKHLAALQDISILASFIYLERVLFPENF